MVQLYLRPLYPGPQDAQQQLRAINTAYLPGQTTKLQFNVQAAQDFAVYDPAQRRFVVKPGDYEIQLGASSADIRLRQKSTFSRNYHCGFIELGAVGAEFYKNGFLLGFALLQPGTTRALLKKYNLESISASFVKFPTQYLSKPQNTPKKNHFKLSNNKTF